MKEEQNRSKMNEKEIKIGSRVGIPGMRGMTLIGHEPESNLPYITDRGRFKSVIIDHDPEMDDWIEAHVT